MMRLLTTHLRTKQTVDRKYSKSSKRRGRTAMGVRVEVIATRARGQQEVKVTEGMFTFVALDDEHKPWPLPED